MFNKRVVLPVPGGPKNLNTGFAALDVQLGWFGFAGIARRNLCNPFAVGQVFFNVIL